MIRLESEQQPLWQWDTGRRLVLSEDPAGTVVDFIQIGFQTKSAIAQEQNGTVYVQIPNEMLYFNTDLKVYIRRTEDDDSQTVFETSFPVHSRPKPEDYIASEAEILTWKKLEARITALEQDGTGGGTPNSVQFVPQQLSTDQQIQARENIGAQPKGDYAEKNEIPVELKELSEDPQHRTVTDEEKTKWNAGVSIPKYAAEEAHDVAKRVQSTRTAKTLVLSALSDWHLQSGRNDDTMKSAVLAGQGLAEIKKQVSVDADLLLGDYTWGADNYTAATCMNDMIGAKTTLPLSVNGLWGRGNHDLNYGKNRDRMLTESELYAYIDANSTDVVLNDANPNGGYCYRDFPRQKIRVIMLNTCDVYGERTQPSVGTRAIAEWIGIEQSKWVADVALDFSDQKAPGEWGVVFVSHYPINYNYNVFSSFLKMLESYRDRTSGRTSYSVDGKTYTHDYDFSQVTPAKIICALNGHSHNFRTDYVSSGKTVPKWLPRMTVPNICVGRENEAAASENTVFAQLFGEFDSHGKPIYYRKTPGTAKGTSFYMISIDREKECIYGYCYGAGHDVILPFHPTGMTYQVRNDLTNVSSSNTSTTADKNSRYTAKLIPNDGYEMQSVTVSMGGTDVTASAYQSGNITIEAVTGDIVITASAAKIVTYTNQIPISLARDLKTVYDGDGIKENTYLSGSTANDSTKTGIMSTGHIPIDGTGANLWPNEFGRVVLRFKNMGFKREGSDCRLAILSEDLSKHLVYYAGDFLTADTMPDQAKILCKVDSDNYITEVDISKILRYTAGSQRWVAKWLRVCSPNITSASVITINEPII